MTVRLRSISLVLAILAMLPAASAAQSSSITFGVKGGVNSAKISSDSSPNVKMRLGAVGGLFLGKQITDSVALQIEGLYSQRGGTEDVAGTEVNYRVNYLDVPVLLKFGSAAGDEMRFSAFAGAQGSYKLKAEANGKINGAVVTVDLDDEVEDFDFSAVFGVGVERGRLSLDARYSHGLTNFATTAGETAKNRTFAVMVGLRLK